MDKLQMILTAISDFIKNMMQPLVTIWVLAVGLGMVMANTFTEWNPPAIIVTGVLAFWLGDTFIKRISGLGNGKSNGTEPPKANSGQSTATAGGSTAVVDDDQWTDSGHSTHKPKPIIPKPNVPVILAGDTYFELPPDAPSVFNRQAVDDEIRAQAQINVGKNEQVTPGAMYYTARAKLCGGINTEEGIDFSTTSALKDAMLYLFELVDKAFTSIHDMTYAQYMNPETTCTDCGKSCQTCKCKPKNSQVKQYIKEEYESIQQIIAELG